MKKLRSLLPLLQLSPHSSPSELTRATLQLPNYYHALALAISPSQFIDHTRDAAGAESVVDIHDTHV